MIAISLGINRRYDESKPPLGRCGVSLQFRFTPAHFGQHAEIRLQEGPNREYTVRLFVENMERVLEKKDNQTWTPAQRVYVLFSHYVHSLKVVNLQRYFSDIRDARGGPNEERSFIVGETSTDRRSDRPSGTFQ